MTVKRILLTILISLLLALVQISFLPVLFSMAIYPNLILAFSFSLFSLGRTRQALFSSLAGGLILDLLGTTLIGLSTFLFVLFFLALTYVRLYLYRSHITKALVLFLLSALYLAVLSNLHIADWVRLLYSGLATLVFGMVFYSLLGRIFNEQTVV